jgi:peroxiredoxin Q/BCP
MFFVAATVWGSCLLAGCLDPAFKSPAKQEEAASKHSQAVNNPAPDFTLLDQNGTQVTLSSLKGQWVVLYFYPQDDTPGCTCEATEFTSLLGSFRQMNARIYGISGDSPSSHQQFIKAYKLGLDLLSDPGHKVMREYGAWVDASLGQETYSRVIRTTMIIDPNGIIRYHWPEVVPDGHADRVRQKLAQLQAQSK